MLVKYPPAKVRGITVCFETLILEDFTVFSYNINGIMLLTEDI